MNKTIVGILILIFSGLQFYLAIKLFNLRKRMTVENRSVIEKQIKKVDNFSKTIQVIVLVSFLIGLFFWGFE